MWVAMQGDSHAGRHAGWLCKGSVMLGDIHVTMQEVSHAERHACGYARGQSCGETCRWLCKGSVMLGDMHVAIQESVMSVNIQETIMLEPLLRHLSKWEGESLDTRLACVWLRRM